MNLFRSEEHVRNWPGYVQGTDRGIVTLRQTVDLFSGNFFSKRLEPDYVSNSGTYVQEFLAALAAMGPFWAPPKQTKAA